MPIDREDRRGGWDLTLRGAGGSPSCEEGGVALEEVKSGLEAAEDESSAGSVGDPSEGVGETVPRRDRTDDAFLRIAGARRSDVTDDCFVS